MFSVIGRIMDIVIIQYARIDWVADCHSERDGEQFWGKHGHQDSETELKGEREIHRGMSEKRTYLGDLDLYEGWIFIINAF